MKVGRGEEGREEEEEKEWVEADNKGVRIFWVWDRLVSKVKAAAQGGKIEGRTKRLKKYAKSEVGTWWKSSVSVDKGKGVWLCMWGNEKVYVEESNEWGEEHEKKTTGKNERASRCAVVIGRKNLVSDE